MGHRVLHKAEFGRSHICDRKKSPMVLVAYRKVCKMRPKTARCKKNTHTRKNAYTKKNIKVTIAFHEILCPEKKISNSFTDCKIYTIYCTYIYVHM